MKVELESLKGYSIKKLFSKLDRLKRGFIDVSSIREFIQRASAFANMSGVTNKAQAKKKMKPARYTGLMRRIVTNTDGKITFTEFAKLMRPVDLRPYLRRISKFTKEEKKQAEHVKHQSYLTKFKQSRLDLRKPLTAFRSSEVMLNRDPERHVGLMPVQYGVGNDFVESGKIKQFQQRFDHKGSDVLWSDTQDGDEAGLIGRETKLLQQPTDSHLKKSAKVLGCEASTYS